MKATATFAMLACAWGCKGGSGDGGLTDDPFSGPNSGVVLLTSGSDATQATGLAFAEFTTVFQPSCGSTSSEGPCVVETNTSNCLSAGPWANAGTITIGNASEPITMSPGSDNTYETFLQQALFAPGSTLAIDATGSDTPALSLTFDTPSLATVSAPALDATTAFDRSRDLALAWSGADSGDVVVVLSNAPMTAATVACTFDGTARSGTIPAAALSALTAGSASFAVETFAREATTQSGWTVTVEAVVDALRPDGTFANAIVTLR